MLQQEYQTASGAVVHDGRPSRIETLLRYFLRRWIVPTCLSCTVLGFRLIDDREARLLAFSIANKVRFVANVADEINKQKVIIM